MTGEKEGRVGAVPGGVILVIWAMIQVLVMGLGQDHRVRPI